MYICVKPNRTTRSHPRSESEIGPSSCDNLKRNHISPKKVEMQRSLPGSSLPLKNLKDSCMLNLEGKIDLTNISSDTSEDFTRQQENLNSIKRRDVTFIATETKSDKKDCPFVICDQKSVDGTLSKDDETPSQNFLKKFSDPAEKSCPSDREPETDASLLPHTSVLVKPIFHFVTDIHANLEMNDTVFESQDNEILNSSIKNSTCTNSSEPIFIQNKIPVLQINETRPAKTESKDKYVKDTLKPSTVPVEENITDNVDQTAEYSFNEQRNNENSKIITQNAATCWNELPQPACTPVYNSPAHSFGTSYPYYAWCVYHYSSSSGNSITQTYQGVTSCEVQPPSSEMLTAVPSTVQNTHSNLLYSQYFGYFAGQPQAYNLVPASGYFQTRMPISFNFQQPAFSQYASYHPLPQAAYPYPPDSAVLPEVPWTYG